MVATWVSLAGVAQPAGRFSRRYPAARPARGGDAEARGHETRHDGRVPAEVGEFAMKYGLLWLVGVPIPVLIVLYFLFH